MLFHFHDFELDERLYQLRRGSKSVQGRVRQGLSELRSKNEELTRFPAKVEERRARGDEGRMRAILPGRVPCSDKRSGAETLLKRSVAMDEDLKAFHSPLQATHLPHDPRGGTPTLNAAEVLPVFVWGAWRGLVG